MFMCDCIYIYVCASCRRRFDGKLNVKPGFINRAMMGLNMRRYLLGSSVSAAIVDKMLKSTNGQKISSERQQASTLSLASQLQIT